MNCKTILTFLVGKNNADAIHKLGNASISQTKTNLDIPTNMQVYFSCREREILRVNYKWRVTRSKPFVLHPGATQEMLLPARCQRASLRASHEKQGVREDCPLPLFHSLTLLKNHFSCHFPQKSGLFSVDGTWDEQPVIEDMASIIFFIKKTLRELSRKLK